MAETLYLYADGGSRNNPGPAAIGVVIKDPRGGTLKEISRLIGVKTNNEAEYQAIIAGLSAAGEFKPDRLVCFLDSNLAVNQLNGRYKVKAANLRPLLFKIQKLLGALPPVEFRYISREKNREADRLVNQAFRRA